MSENIKSKKQNAKYSNWTNWENLNVKQKNKKNIIQNIFQNNFQTLCKLATFSFIYIYILSL